MSNLHLLKHIFIRKLSFVQLKLTVLYCYFLLQIILCLTLGVFMLVLQEP